MKILIISDTHRRDEMFTRVMEQEAPVDMILHAGDAEGSEDEFSRIAGMRILCVAGNNDYGSLSPRTLLVPIGSRRAFLTHGHLYQVYLSTDAVEREARMRHCQIAIFGHTHVPLLKSSENGILLLNPGSLGYPRQAGYRPSYAVIETNAQGDLVKTEIRYL